MLRDISKEELQSMANEKGSYSEPIKELIKFCNEMETDVRISLKTYTNGTECLVVYVYDTLLRRYRTYEKIYLD